MFKKKTDGRFRIEMKFKNGSEAFMVDNNYEKICSLYELVKKPLDDKFCHEIIEAVLYDKDTPLASWTNSLALLNNAA